jgi:hypothetical protein
MHKSRGFGWMLDAGCLMLDSGFWILDAGFKDSGMLDAGHSPRFPHSTTPSFLIPDFRFLHSFISDSFNFHRGHSL